MCDHNPREPAMTVLGENVWCDPCIAPIVKALNDGGLVTVASCCGHGQRLGSVTLADGRWFVIVPSDEAVDRLAALPTHIAGATAPNPEANLTAARDAAVARAEAAEAVIERVRALADAYARSMSGMFTGQLLARDIRAALDPAGPTDA